MFHAAAWPLPGDVYDAERRRVSWNVTGSGKEAYDGEGQRVAHQSTSGITNTTTYYVGSLKEVDGASGAVTKYYATTTPVTTTTRIWPGAVPIRASWRPV